MKAKETVMGMNSGLVQGLYLKSQQIKEVLEAQAEISFPLGEVEGRRQIVKWVEREFGVDWSGETEQLRKWGIKDGDN